MTTPFFYRAFGINIESDLELPELRRVQRPHSSSDVRIELAGKVASGTPQDADGGFRECPDGGFVLRINDVADYWVANGNLIRIAVHPGSDAGTARLYLLGSALGMVLHQRGLLVMHASAVLRAGAVTLFIGDSGAGKSTLAAAFLQAGCGVLADDVVPIRPTDDLKVAVWPGSLSIKLWSDSLEALGLEREGLVQVANRYDKYFVTNGEAPSDIAYPVREIVVLDAVEGSVCGGLETMSTLEAIGAVSRNTYRSEYVDLLNRRTEHFEQCVSLASVIPVLRLRRPWDPLSLAATWA